MTKSIHLSLDAMGGDNAPQIIVDGAAQSKIRYPDVKFSFFGNKNKLLPLLSSLKILKDSEIIQGIFSLKYLTLFAKCTNLCPSIQIYLKNHNNAKLHGAQF